MFATHRIRRTLAAFVLAALLLSGASCRAQTSAQTEMVAMSDGVKLATDVYLPIYAPERASPISDQD